MIYDNIMANIDIFTTGSVSLLELRLKFVNLQLKNNSSIKGFVYAIDPDQYSIILLDPSGENFQTMLIPGHAILNVSVISNEKISLHKTEAAAKNVIEKKEKLKSWLQLNLLPVTETEENITFGGVTILPPYNVTNIYSTSPIVAKQVKDLMERMPHDF